jgi:membrane fusion protein, multidrug efflux system
MRGFKAWQIALAAAVAIGAAIILWRMLAGRGAAADEPPPPSALITVAPVRAGDVRETVSAYGVIAGSAASTRTLAVPRAVIVERLLTPVGTPVAAGAPLMILVNSPASTQAYRQAADGAAFTERDLARVRRLFDAHLAANDQLIAAQKALADAKAALAAQNMSGAGAGRQTLAAPYAGVIVAAPVATGEHVAADVSLITLAGGADLVAQLGVEPRRAQALAVGQAVTLIPVFHSERRIASRLSLVTRQLDAASKMIDAAAPVTAAAGLPLGEAVRGQIVVASHPGLLVPRAAVVFDEQGSHVFVVARGKARLVAVQAGAEEGDDIAVAGGVKAGDPVAVQGAYQLEDGMAVRIARP